MLGDRPGSGPLLGRGRDAGEAGAEGDGGVPDPLGDGLHGAQGKAELGGGPGEQQQLLVGGSFSVSSGKARRQAKRERRMTRQLTTSGREVVGGQVAQVLLALRFPRQLLPVLQAPHQERLHFPSAAALVFRPGLLNIAGVCGWTTRLRRAE